MINDGLCIVYTFNNDMAKMVSPFGPGAKNVGASDSKLAFISSWFSFTSTVFLLVLRATNKEPTAEHLQPIRPRHPVAPGSMPVENTSLAFGPWKRWFLGRRIFSEISWDLVQLILLDMVQDGTVPRLGGRTGWSQMFLASTIDWRSIVRNSNTRTSCMILIP